VLWRWNKIKEEEKWEARSFMLGCGLTWRGKALRCALGQKEGSRAGELRALKRKGGKVQWRIARVGNPTGRFEKARKVKWEGAEEV
jgi:hypothetical protein